MFRFIHTYTEDSFAGLFEKGLFRPGDGLKLMHKHNLPEKYSFNEIAKKDGLLWQRVKEFGCPFYIDRYQGGLPFLYKYDFDKELIAAYKELLGDNFLGFQLHEWGSNFIRENLRILSKEKAWIEKYGSLDGFWEHYIELANSARDVAFLDFYTEKVNSFLTPLFVEAWTVEEWAKMEHPRDMETMVREMYRLLNVRKAEIGCDFIPADAFFFAPKINIECGAKLLLPEIGWQLSDTRLQIAYTRGMAQAAGISWGVYYECWSVENRDLTIPYAADTPDNEWIEPELRDLIVERTNGHPENGGSARSLQERMWVYSYFSGAQYMGEEYGVCTTFRNYRDYELSEYGQVKKNFLDFTTKYPDLGKPYTPVAIVIPAELPGYSTMEPKTVFMESFPLAGTAEIEGFQPINETLSEKIRAMRQGMERLYHGHRSGHASYCMRNSPYPDVFDVLHGDMTDAIARYDYIIDLTGDEAFAAAHDNIITPEELREMLKTMLPCTFSEELHVAYNKTDDGWLVFIANNNGIERTIAEGEWGREDARIVADILTHTPDVRIEKMAGNGTLHGENGYRAELGAGQWMILTVNC